MVVATSPTAGGTDVPYDTVITVTFSEPIDTSTVHGASFTIKDDQGRSIPGTIMVDATSATFTPDAPITYEGNYTATITTDVTDALGNPMASQHVWSFTTHLRQWQAAEVIGTSGWNPQVAVDAQGRALAVWYENGASTISVNRFVPGAGWGTAEAISAPGAVGQWPQLAMNGNGDGVAIWEQFNTPMWQGSCRVTKVA